jgi:uncharacterized membrane protein
MSNTHGDAVRWTISWGKAVCLIGIALYTLAFTYLQIQLYRGLHMGITDLGYFDQSMYNTLHGQTLAVSFDVPSAFRQLQSSNSPHLFAQHPFVLMLGLVYPLYALVPHTYTLFAIQAFAAAVGALPIYLLAREKTDYEWPAVALSLAFLLHPTLQFITVNMFTFGFHPENLFPLLFLFAFYFLHEEKWVPFALFFLLSVLVVDSYTLVCAALGVYVILRSRQSRRRWLGLAMIGVSLAWLAVALKVIVQYFKVGGGAPWFVTDMKGGQVILEKLSSLPALIAPVLAEYLARVLGPFLFLPFAGLGVLAVALPILAVNFSALLIGYDAPASYVGWQSNPVVPVAALAGVWGFAWVQRRFLEPRLKLPDAAATAGGASPIRHPGRVALLSVAVLAAAVIADVWYGPLPFSLDVSADQYSVDPARVAAIDRLQRLIPESAVLSADYYLGSQFTHRPQLFWFPDRWAQADYVLIDRSSEWSAVYSQQLEYLENSPYHEVAFDRSDIVLYRRRPTPSAPPTRLLDANFSNLAKLTGVKLVPETPLPGGTLRVTLFWQASGPTPVPYTVFVHLLDANGRVVSQKDGMPMSNQHPTTEWQAGETIVDMFYDLPLEEQIAPGQYSLEIGLYRAGGHRLDVLDALGNPKDARVVVPGIRVGAP